MVKSPTQVGGGGNEPSWRVVDHCGGQKTTTKWVVWADVGSGVCFGFGLVIGLLGGLLLLGDINIKDPFVL